MYELKEGNVQKTTNQTLHQELLERRQREREQTAVLTMASAMRTATDHHAIISVILDTLLDIFASDAAAFTQIAGEQDEQIIEQGRGAWQEWAGRTLAPLSPANRITIGASTIYLNNTSEQAKKPPADPLQCPAPAACVILESNEQRLGALWVGGQQPITEQDLRILAAIGSMVANALQRIRTQAETRRRAEQLAAINRLGGLIAKTFDQSFIYTQICQTARALLPEITVLYIEQFDRKQQLLSVVYGYQQDQTVDVDRFAPLALGAQELELQRHALFVRQPAIWATNYMACVYQPHELMVCAPMIAHGECVGILQVSSDCNYRFNDMDREFLTLLANTAAIFIQYAMLFHDLQRSNAQVKRELLERKEAEITIRRQLSVMENSIDGIALVNHEECYTYVNAAYARLYGFDHPHQLLGQSWRQQYAPQQQAYLEQTVYPALQTDGTWQGELTGLCIDGRTFQQEISIVALENREFACIVRDITERKHAEEALRHSQKLESLGLLAGGVAHDFNNLLAGILGHASLAQVKLPVDNPARTHVEKAIATTKRAADLTRQLLNYTGNGRGQVELFDINTLLNESKVLFETIVPKHVQLVFALSPKLPAVQGDLGQIQQVLMNLIINAAEAIGAKNGQVHVTTGACHITSESEVRPKYIGGNAPAPGYYAVITVEDNGVGIDAQVLDRIFDPFFSTKGYGRGLGLSATLGIVRQHKGALQVTSQPGEGSTFQVLLPALSATALPAVEPETDKVARRLEGVVLVIEDEAMLREVMSETLQSIGLQVVTAENGRQGLEVFHRYYPNIALVVLDMQMPVMNGADTLRELMAIDSTIKVLVTSGYSDSTAINQYGDTASIAFLQKPYSSGTFIRAVTEQIAPAQTKHGLLRVQPATVSAAAPHAKELFVVQRPNGVARWRN
jgi:PAS domain S-box-containing protein